MASGTGHGPGGFRGEAWDGLARCRLCSSDPQADHDWCRAAAALVCDSCCEDVLRGEPGRLSSVANASPQTVGPMEIIAACMVCPRLERMLVDDEPADGAPRYH